MAGPATAAVTVAVLAGGARRRGNGEAVGAGSAAGPVVATGPLRRPVLAAPPGEASNSPVNPAPGRAGASPASPR